MQFEQVVGSFSKGIPALLTAFVVLTCSSLSVWQLNRAHDKEVLLSEIKISQNKPQTTFTQFNQLTKDNQKNGVFLTVKGDVDPRFWLLDNRIVRGQVGYDVIIVVNEHTSKQKVLVNLGWIAAGRDRVILPSFSLPTHVELDIQMQSDVKKGFSLAKTSTMDTHWPKVIQYISLPEMAKHLSVSEIRYFGYATKGLNSTQPHYKPVVMPPEKHRAYALQWALLAVAALCVFVFAYKKSKKEKNNE